MENNKVNKGLYKPDILESLGRDINYWSLWWLENENSYAMFIGNFVSEKVAKDYAKTFKKGLKMLSKNNEKYYEEFKKGDVFLLAPEDYFNL
jgi:hypothetical protein